MMELHRQIKKNRHGPNAYTMKIGRSMWGLRKHHINAQYYFAVPINDTAHKRCGTMGQSPFRGLWFFKNERGNWDLTRTPEIWCDTPWGFLQ